MNEKEIEYAIKIQQAIGELLQEESNNYINPEEFEEGDNLTHFIHALANVAPTQIYNKITSSDANMLEFNHVANMLCFQYSKKVKIT